MQQPVLSHIRLSNYKAVPCISLNKLKGKQQGIFITDVNTITYLKHVNLGTPKKIIRRLTKVRNLHSIVYGKSQCSKWQQLKSLN